MKTILISLFSLLPLNLFADYQFVEYEKELLIETTDEPGVLNVVDQKTKKSKCSYTVYTDPKNPIVSLELRGELVVVMAKKGDRHKVPVSYLCK